MLTAIRASPGDAQPARKAPFSTRKQTTMKDRRSYERFPLELQSSLYSWSETCWTEGLQVTTRDISSAGLYIETEHPLPANVPVRVELSIPLQHGYQQASRGWVLISTGSVIRQDRDGMAVKFDKSQLFTLLNRPQN
jgi:hypothetical protein